MDVCRVGAACEAVDSNGHWKIDTIVSAEECESLKVSFDGWDSIFDRLVLTDELRLPTEIGNKGKIQKKFLSRLDFDIMSNASFFNNFSAQSLNLAGYIVTANILPFKCKIRG